MRITVSLNSLLVLQNTEQIKKKDNNNNRTSIQMVPIDDWQLKRNGKEAVYAYS